MGKYNFTFDRLTIGDVARLIAASQQNDVPAFMQVVDSCLPGGVLDLPFSETQPLLGQFAEQFRVFAQDTQSAGDQEIMRLIRQALEKPGDA